MRVLRCSGTFKNGRLVRLAGFRPLAARASIELRKIQRLKKFEKWMTSGTKFKRRSSGNCTEKSNADHTVKVLNTRSRNKDPLGLYAAI